MIPLLLDEPYFKADDVPEVLWHKAQLVDELKPYHFYLTFVYGNGFASNCRFRHKGRILESREDLIEAFSDFLIEIEDDLIFEIYSLEVEDPNKRHKFRNLSLSQRCEILEINEYLGDRNLNDLINYIKFFIHCF